MKSLLLAFFLGSAVVSFGQSSAPDIKVVNDPLFWKGDLKLTRRQCMEIDSANTEFYQSVRDVLVGDNENRNKKQLETLLQQRSNSIWNVFSSRQKSKWLRIEQAKNIGLKRILPFV